MKKVTVNTHQGTFEIEGEDDKELFKEMAVVHELYSESRCGLCGSEVIVPVVRKNKSEDEFFEYQCRGFTKDNKPCRAYLAFGQNKKGGGLFPIRALTEEGKPDRENGKFGRHNGWSRYRGEPKPDQEQVKK